MGYTAEETAVLQDQIRITRDRFEERFFAALKFARNKKKRLALYQEWRKSIGDNAARESAKYVEVVLNGTVQRPKWFKT